MPFTPFHLGPGVVAKAVAGKTLTLTVFGFAQVASDLEALVRLLRGDSELHGFCHTYLGATLIGGISLVFGRPVCQLLLNEWNPEGSSTFLAWLRGPRTISWPAATLGAFLGTYSHVLIDSMIHADVRPFAPVWQGNPLLGQSSFGAMHFSCIAAGVVGAIGIAARYLLSRRPRA